MTTCYYEGMNELTITQTREILGMSYPTAFKIANEVGTMRDGVWYIPAEYVDARVKEIEELARSTRVTYNTVVYASQPA